MENLSELRSALFDVDKASAELLNDPNTEVKELPTSFLETHQILHILWRRVVSPIMFYVGFASPKSIFFLTGDPEAYIKMSRADKVSLESPEQALEYFSTFLEVTRPMTRLFYLVRSVDEIMWRKSLNETEATRMKSIREKYQNTIPPHVKMIGHRYQVTCHAVQGTELIEFHSLITASGMIELESKILEKKLPSAIGA